MTGPRNDRPLVIFHSPCADGFGAALATWMAIGDSADYLGLDHGAEPPDVTGRKVYLLDFTFKRLPMLALIAQASCVIVLDHHESAVSELADVYCQCGGMLFDTTHSGAVLAWQFFHPGEEVPLLLQYIQDRDLCRFDLPEAKEFLSGLDNEPRTFQHWRSLIEEGDAAVTRMVSLGRPLLAQTRRICSVIAEAARPLTLDGVVGASVTCPPELANEVGSALIQRGAPFAALWHAEANGRVKVSLRSRRGLPMHEIAKRFGGGGSKAMSSFRIPPARVLELLAGQLDPE